MLTIIIATLIGTPLLLLCIGAFIEKGHSVFDRCSAGIICIVLMAGLIGVSVVIARAPPEYRELVRRDLVAFSGDSALSGSFFLGCGTINDSDVYRYLYEREDGAIKQGRVRVDDACIFEGDEVPRVVIHEQTRVSRNFRLDARGQQWACYRYEFHIPPNSILRDFELDISGKR